ncbi:pyridoxal-phosphate dependent enzyme [Streptomyces sp. NPDC048644]|uniref:threonine synthase n=1 Tax=Streptomyces sp. NPDC048644 TaxID=3365582 RepID=UPI0037138223
MKDVETYTAPEFVRSPALRALECIQCSARYPVDDHPRGCPACDAAGRNANLFCVYDERADGLEDRLPYRNTPALGEGGTPLLRLPWLAGASVKNEAANPTGSHKDRFAAMAVAHAAASGFDAVAIGSSGNAGIALAAYAAAAGLRCTVAGFSRLPEATRQHLTDLGADLRLFDTDRERVGCVRELGARADTLAVSNIATPFVGCHPVGIEGYKRISWEIAGQAPAEVRHVVLPTCRGDLAWGVHRGFCELSALRGTSVPRLHLVEPIPRLAAVLDGAPVTGHFPGDSGRLYSIGGHTTTVQAHRALTGSGGSAVVVDDAAADVWFTRLCRRGHVWERSSATVFAAYERLRADGVIGDAEHTVLLATSHFFKGL